MWNECKDLRRSKKDACNLNWFFLLFYRIRQFNDLTVGLRVYSKANESKVDPISFLNTHSWSIHDHNVYDSSVPIFLKKKTVCFLILHWNAVFEPNFLPFSSDRTVSSTSFMISSRFHDLMIQFPELSLISCFSSQIMEVRWLRKHHLFRNLVVTWYGI